MRFGQWSITRTKNLELAELVREQLAGVCRTLERPEEPLKAHQVERAAVELMRRLGEAEKASRKVEKVTAALDAAGSPNIGGPLIRIKHLGELTAPAQKALNDAGMGAYPAADAIRMMHEAIKKTGERADRAEGKLAEMGVEA